MSHRYEILPDLSYPFGASANLDESLTFLRIADAAGPLSHEPNTDLPIKRYQTLYDEIYFEFEDYDLSFAAARDKNGVIVAAAVYGHDTDFDPHFASLNILAVDEPYRRQGIGRGLLQFVENEVARNGAETLWLASTPEAYQLYLSEGFIDISEEPDDLIRQMQKDLSTERK